MYSYVRAPLAVGLAFASAAALSPGVLSRAPCRGWVCMKAEARGFAKAKAKTGKRQKRAPVVPLEPSLQAAIDVLAKSEASLESYLNPQLFEDPETMAGIGRRIPRYANKRRAEKIYLNDLSSTFKTQYKFRT